MIESLDLFNNENFGKITMPVEIMNHSKVSPFERIQIWNQIKTKNFFSIEIRNGINDRLVSTIWFEIKINQEDKE